MMYVITDHNNGNFVLLGPIEWKPRYMTAILSDEYDADIQVTSADIARVPFEIIPGVKIRKCNSIYEDIDEKIEKYDGPFWTYDDTNVEFQATATWTRADKDINIVKGVLKDEVANLRWEKEKKGVYVNIQSTNVWCDTSRGNRDIFLQKYTLMGDADIIKWKFQDNIWLNITKPELGQIVFQGLSYVQNCFDWESTWNDTINNCTTLAELAALNITIEE